MALDDTVPIDGDGITTGVRVSELAGSIRTLRTDINTILDGYDTGWIARSDWTNVHMGSSTTKNADSDVTHSLDAPLSDLLVGASLSSDGTDANSFGVAFHATAGANIYGLTIYETDSNIIQIQTATLGLLRINTDGTVLALDSEDWFYKIKVWKLG